ncbi:MAG: gliding motility protein GldN [Bacteroidetes bacterium]|nr:gliding motility protein GldN [Bacteroidota bacterium]
MKALKTSSIAFIALLFGLTFPNIGLVQTDGSTVLDGAYSATPHEDGLFRRNSNLAKGLVPYPSIREADVMYTKRVWQMIDLREKVNHPMYFPVTAIQSNDWKQLNLFDAIAEAALKGLFPIYSSINPDDPRQSNDTFNFKMSQEQVQKTFTTSEEIIDDHKELWTDNETDVYLATGVAPLGYADTTIKSIPLSSESIIGYKIKEDWIWDRQRGQRFVRIIGIAPIIQEESVGGNGAMELKELCWIYYPEARAALNKYDSYNPLNDAARRTYAEIFEYRYFSSYVVKESNVYDRDINSYARGLDAIAESERIKEDLFILEHDLWHY